MIKKLLNSLHKGWVEEHKFHPTRKWRFDFANPELKLAIEIEGGAWTQGRHTRGKGFIGDMEKYNAAVVLGWRILRYVPMKKIKDTGDMMRDVEAFLSLDK